MKISFECECILLQKALMLFLGKFAARRKDCDLIISDKKIEANKPIFIIGENSPYLKFPFNKQDLICTLEDFYSAMQIEHNKTIDTISNNFDDKFNALFDKFKLDLTELIKNELKK